MSLNYGRILPHFLLIISPRFIIRFIRRGGEEISELLLLLFCRSQRSFLPSLYHRQLIVTELQTEGADVSISHFSIGCQNESGLQQSTCSGKQCLAPQ